MKKDDVIIGVFSAITGIVFLIMSYPLGFVEKNGIPAAGFFPLISSAGLILISCFLIIIGLRSDDRVSYWYLKPFQAENKRSFFLTIAGIVAFLVLWKYVSFTIAAYLLSLYLNYVYKQSFKYNVIFTLVFITVLIICFQKIMLVQFSL